MFLKQRSHIYFIKTIHLQQPFYELIGYLMTKPNLTDMNYFGFNQVSSSRLQHDWIFKLS